MPTRKPNPCAAPYTCRVPQEDPDRLTAEDAHILSVESTAITGHTLKLVVLEPGATPLNLEQLQSEVAERLPTQRRAMQRIDISSSHRRWVSVTDFDINDHVRRREATDCVSTADLWRGLRRWLSAGTTSATALPRLPAQIPVSLHHRDEGETSLGNRDSFLNIELPVGESEELRSATGWLS